MCTTTIFRRQSFTMPCEFVPWEKIVALVARCFSYLSTSYLTSVQAVSDEPTFSKKRNDSRTLARVWQEAFAGGSPTLPHCREQDGLDGLDSACCAVCYAFVRDGVVELTAGEGRG